MNTVENSLEKHLGFPLDTSSVTLGQFLFLFVRKHAQTIKRYEVNAHILLE